MTTNAKTGITSNQQAIVYSSNNLANANSTSFKRSDTIFTNLMSGSIASGVKCKAIPTVNSQGSLIPTDNPNDCTIEGKGFFSFAPVGNGNRGALFGRSCMLDVNKDGWIVDKISKSCILAWNVNSAQEPIKADGSPANQTSMSDMIPLNVKKISGIAQTTSSFSLNMVLPADPLSSPLNDQKFSSINIIDSLGGVHKIDVKWEKTQINPIVWDVTFSSSDPADEIKHTDNAGADFLNNPIRILFDDKGKPRKYTNDNSLPVVNPGDVINQAVDAVVDNIYFKWNNNPAAPQTVKFDLGPVGPSNTSLLCLNTDFEQTGQNINGMPYGAFKNFFLTSDGQLKVLFDNNQTVTIAKVPLITFPDVNNLKPESNGLFNQTAESGTVLLGTAGKSGYGTIMPGHLEGSNVSTEDVINKIVEQKFAYNCSTDSLRACMEMRNMLLTLLSKL